MGGVKQKLRIPKGKTGEVARAQGSRPKGGESGALRNHHEP
jgi:hypothetical protein